MSKYIITGATSFIGKAVVEELLRAGHQVYVVIRPESEKKHWFDGRNNCFVILTDIKNIEICEENMQKADYFMHFGWDGIGAQGRSNPDIQAENVKNTVKCIETAVKLKCRGFVFAGSQAEYGIKHELIKETLSCEPVIEYGKAKLKVLNEGMRIAQTNELNYYHARIFSVYGVGDHPWTLVSSCVKGFLSGKEVKTSSGEQMWNFMYIDDIAKALIMLTASNATTGIYNIASKDTRPLKEFIQEIYQCCGEKGKLLMGTHNPVEIPNNLIPDVSKLESVIGNIPETKFSDGIKEMILQFKQEDKES